MVNKLERRLRGIRKVRRVVAIWRSCNHWAQLDDFYAVNGELEKMMRKTRVPCSGICCGNPRKWFGKKTKQELMSDEEYEKDREQSNA
jgi:hypothetical protein